ncbi:hypothetical protein GCM10009801_78490 [Streptomyces albiaxialis]|uniref:Uncharacterized protein n=1 Tax=Streptomyces albiaxialis TaxID=329523 RepID=A0ABN2X4C7_9ACTN
MPGRFPFRPAPPVSPLPECASARAEGAAVEAATATAAARTVRRVAGLLIMAVIPQSVCGVRCLSARRVVREYASDGAGVRRVVPVVRE